MKHKLKFTWKLLKGMDGTIVRGFSSILMLRLVEKLAGFVLITALFRLLDKELVAEYGFIQTVLSLCAVFGIQEFQNSISQSVSRGFPGTYRQAMLVSLRWSLVGVGILIGFAAWYTLAGQSRLGFGFIIAASLFPTLHALSHWKGVFLGEKNFTAFAFAEASNAIAKTLLILAVLLVFSISEIGMDWTNSATWISSEESTSAILAVIFIFLVVPSLQNVRQSLLCRKRISTEAPVEPGAIAYGLRANWYSAIGNVGANLDRLLIFTLLPASSLAIFMAAEKFADLLQSIVQDLGAVLAPKFATVEYYSRSLDDKLKLISLVIGLSVIIFAITVLPSLLVMIFGKAYLESVIYAQLLVGAVVLNNMATLRFRFIRSRLDAASYRNVLVFSSVIKVAASVALIPVFGLKGAIASVILHRILLAGVIGYIIRTKYLKLDAPDDHRANA